MERVLLWLDELDDCVAISVHSLGRLRIASLEAGFAAALPLPLLEAARPAFAHVFAVLAAASVLVWTGAAAAELAGRRAAAARLEMR